MVWIVLAAAALAVLIAIGMYNSLIRLKVQSDGAWADIDVQLKRRHDLIPNLVETVKGCAGHERSTMEVRQLVRPSFPSQRFRLEPDPHVEQHGDDHAVLAEQLGELRLQRRKLRRRIGRRRRFLAPQPRIPAHLPRYQWALKVDVLPPMKGPEAHPFRGVL